MVRNFPTPFLIKSQMSSHIEGIRYLNPEFRRALILENPDPSLDVMLEAEGIEVERLPDSATLDVDFVKERLREGRHDLIFKRSRFPVDREVLQASDRLAAVVLCCIGSDSVDLDACAEQGVLVINDPVSNGRSVAELVIGEMILLARRVLPAHDAGRQSVWTKDSNQRYEILGKHLSIIGLGNIGKQVARLAEALGMVIHFYDPSEVAQEVGIALGWNACTSISDAFRQGDFVTLHASSQDPNGHSNRGLLGIDEFRVLGEARGDNSPRGFINLARGFLFEPEDLKQAVREGPIRGAAVDVFPEEPGSSQDPWENPYADIEQIITTPHIGAATQEAQPRIAAHVAATTRMLNRAGVVRDCVFAPRQVIGVDAAPPYWALAVIHSDERGTKKAIDDSIFEAGANNYQSSHRDFRQFGIAYDVSAIDRPLTPEQLEGLVQRANEISGDTTAIRTIRQFQVTADRIRRS